MTKYRVLWHAPISKHYGIFALERQNPTTEVWEFVRDFSSMTEVEQWMQAAAHHGRVVKEFEV